MANGNGNNIQTFRSWLADMRTKINAEIDDRLARLDEMEQQALKQRLTSALGGAVQVMNAVIGEEPVFELDLKGKPERT